MGTSVSDGISILPQKIRPSETTPLLSGKESPSSSSSAPGGAVLSHGEEFHHHGMDGGSTSSAIFNLSNTIIGAGIMGLPATLKILGVPLGLFVLGLVAFISEYSLQRLLRCTTAAKAWSFGDLMSVMYGRVGRIMLRVCIIVHNIGILVVYFIIMGDVLSGATDKEGNHDTGVLEEWAGGPRWWTARPVVLLAIITTVIGPLVSLPHIDSLRITSGLSVALAVVFVLITIFVTLYKLLHGSIDWSAIRWLPQLGSPSDRWAAMAVVPTMATAFTCHYNIHPILVELEPPREPKLSSAIRSTLLLCTSVYAVTALFGYLLFGEATYADVLANFDRDLGVPGSAALNVVVRVFYVVHLALVFPVIHFSLRAAMAAVIFPSAVPIAHHPRQYIIVTIGLVLGIFLLSSLVPDVQFAFGFVGATGAAALVFIFPGLIALSDRAGALTVSHLETASAWGLLLLGLAVSVSGLTNNMRSLLPHS